jgi:YfiH family protein
MAQVSTRPVSEIPFFQSKDFADPAKDRIAHGFFGRQGGISSGLYESLNCGPGSGDDPENVKANRALVASALGGGKILSLYQIHSAECLAVKDPWDADRPQADAMVSDVPGLVLSILTADCVPVLFHGLAKNKPVIGAAHAGWRGAVGGILERTVEKMVKDYKADPKTIKAIIGPCIHKKSYEVDGGFYETFLKQDPENDRFFQGARKAGHYMFDLPGYCAARLALAGVGKVLIEGSDTYADEARFFSFRRTTHRAEKDYGRQISAILITP